MRLPALLTLTTLVLGAIAGCEVENTRAPQNASSSSSTSEGPPEHPLDQMVIAYEGNHSRAEIKARMDEAMGLYGLTLTEENYSRAGSVLVTMRREYGPAEMDILNYMIRSHAPGTEMSFPDMAAIASTALVVGTP